MIMTSISEILAEQPALDFDYGWMTDGNNNSKAWSWLNNMKLFTLTAMSELGTFGHFQFLFFMYYW